jgi:hypothetical protein
MNITIAIIFLAILLVVCIITYIVFFVIPIITFKTIVYEISINYSVLKDLISNKSKYSSDGTPEEINLLISSLIEELSAKIMLAYDYYDKHPILVNNKECKLGIEFLDSRQKKLFFWRNANTKSTL